MISLLIEFMETEKWGLTGNQFIYATYVLGAIIGAIIVGYGLTVGNNLNSQMMTGANSTLSYIVYRNYTIIKDRKK